VTILTLDNFTRATFVKSVIVVSYSKHGIVYYDINVGLDCYLCKESLNNVRRCELTLVNYRLSTQNRATKYVVNKDVENLYFPGEFPEMQH
jgi:hypothetical protein